MLDPDKCWQSDFLLPGGGGGGRARPDLGLQVNQAGDHFVGLGIKRSVRVLPAGFHHENVLAAGAGITDATRALGDALLTRGGKSRADPSHDFVLSHLGYWTDNGAFYSGNNDRSGFANHEEALKAMKKEWTRLGIPFRWMNNTCSWPIPFHP